MYNTWNVGTIRKKALYVLISLLVMVLLTASLASAAGENATVFVTRLTGTHIGIKIIFPESISGSFAGVIHGNHFKCVTIPSNTLYCIGRLASWVDAATLHIYEHPGGNIIFSKVISSPPRIGNTDVTPPPIEQCPPQECET